MTNLTNEVGTSEATAGQEPRRARGLGYRFALLWAGETTSFAGDQITLIALPLLAVTYASASTFDVGLLAMCLRVPFLLIGLQAGVWVTRVGLNRSMIIADALRCLAVGALPAAIWIGARHLAVLVVAAVAVGIGTVFFQVSYQSFVPELISDQRRWHSANTRLVLSESAALLLGPAVGGLIVARLTAPGALAVDAATYGVSIASLVAIAVRRRRPPRADHARADLGVSLRRQIAEGFRYVLRNPILNSIMWTGAAYNLGSAMYDSLLVVFAVHYLRIPPATLGIAIGAGATGFPIGGALSGRFSARVGLGAALIWAAIPSVAGLLVAGLATGPRPAAFLCAGTFLVGLGQGCFAVNGITLRQLAAPASMRARATSVHRFVSWGALPAGALLGGVVGQVFGLRAAMICAGVIATTCFWPLLASPLRTTRS